MWPDVRHPALKPICSLRISSDGLIDDFYHSCSPVLLGQKHIRCLLYADDLVLLSESQEGLQNCLNKTWEYCKVMIFNKGSIYLWKYLVFLKDSGCTNY
jgi:hypothetical protein